MGIIILLILLSASKKKTMITNPYLKDILVTTIEGTSQLAFGTIAARISHPIPKGEFLKEYENLINKEGLTTTLPVALPVTSGLAVVGEAENPEIEQIRGLIASAITSLETENIEDAKQKIEKAIAETTCNRCSRKMVLVDWGDKKTAAEYLRTMHKLLPSYYTILEGEKGMGISHTQFDFGIGTEQKGKRGAKESASKEEKNNKPCNFCDMLKGIEAYLADMKPIK